MVAAVDGSHMWLQSTGNTDKPVQHIGFFFFYFWRVKCSGEGCPSWRGSCGLWVTVKGTFSSRAFVLHADTQWNKALDSPQRSFREGWHQARTLPKADLNFSVIYVLGSLLISDLMVQEYFAVWSKTEDNEELDNVLCFQPSGEITVISKSSITYHSTLEYKVKLFSGTQILLRGAQSIPSELQ